MATTAEAAADVIAIELAAADIAAAVKKQARWAQLRAGGGGGAQPLYCDPSPLQAGVDFLEFNLPETKRLRSPRPTPRCHRGSREVVRGVHTLVALTGLAHPSGTLGCTRVEWVEEDSEPLPQQAYSHVQVGGRCASTLPPHMLQGRLEEEVVCSCACIGEVHAPNLQLLLHDFGEGGCAFLTPSPL